MFERFTDSARRVMTYAQDEAKEMSHEYVGTEHILLGLVKNVLAPKNESAVGEVLQNLNIDIRKIRPMVEARAKAGPEMVTMGKLPQTPRAKKVIEFAIAEARDADLGEVGDEQLLLGVLREPDGAAAQVLFDLGVNYRDAKDEISRLIDPSMIVRSVPMCVVGDPSILSREEYVELMTMLGDIVRANGGKGVERVWEQDSDLPISAEVPA